MPITPQCLNRAIEVCTKHGHSRCHGDIPTKEYSAWAGLRARCLCKTNKDYSRYGARGITICDRWLDFLNFLADMGPRPEGAFLDRINNDGNYEPSNCRWTTIRESNRNKRGLRWVTLNGETKLIADWSRETGINFHTIRWRLNQGYSPKDALTAGRRRGPAR